MEIDSDNGNFSDRPKSYVVLISDQSESLGWLIATFEHEGLNVIRLDGADEFSQLVCAGPVIVVFDLEPTQLETALHQMRANPLWQQAIVLVRAERIPDTALIAGICPPYRALVCYHDDLAQLVRQHAQPLVPRTSERHPTVM